MTKRVIWTTANWLMLLMFLLSVAVQYNDPDPLRWMSIYGAAAAVCVLELRRRTPAWAPALVAIIAIVWAGTIVARAYDVPILSMFAQWEMKDVHIEEAREMYGLVIVALWMTAVAAARVRARRARA